MVAFGHMPTGSARVGCVGDWSKSKNVTIKS